MKDIERLSNEKEIIASLLFGLIQIHVSQMPVLTTFLFKPINVGALTKLKGLHTTGEYKKKKKPAFHGRCRIEIHSLHQTVAVMQAKEKREGKSGFALCIWTVLLS
jgi:hypothetical protein